jgi:hypothetical protein
LAGNSTASWFSQVAAATGALLALATVWLLCLLLYKEFVNQ